ncbi:MAG: polyprenyl synthetase family protein [Armatimonadetes bacterium]|nr:polyprenyl synthetase family protein [Armatimonadota bacterium]
MYSPSQHKLRTPVHPADLTREGLQRVEQILIEESESSVWLIQNAAESILSAGGKRLRPTLVLLSARAVGYEGERVYPLAAMMELLHTATLIHDDIIDHSTTRRGQASLNEFLGNATSVLIGDFMVSKVFRLIGQDGDPAILRVICDAIIKMCEGEVIQICESSNLQTTIDTYLSIITSKTGILMSSCCKVGALLGENGMEPVYRLEEFGMALGLAFQIIDDILDFTGDEQRLGKPVAGDLREGKITLPLILTLRNARGRDLEWLKNIIHQEEISGEEVCRVMEMMHAYQGISGARATAKDYIRTARQHLSALPPSPAVDALDALADSVVERDM